jgi:hypothetical protein
MELAQKRQGSLTGGPFLQFDASETHDELPSLSAANMWCRQTLVLPELAQPAVPSLIFMNGPLNATSVTVTTKFGPKCPCQPTLRHWSRGGNVASPPMGNPARATETPLVRGSVGPVPVGSVGTALVAVDELVIDREVDEATFAPPPQPTISSPPSSPRRTKWAGLDPTSLTRTDWTAGAHLVRAGGSERRSSKPSIRRHHA